MDDRLDRLRIAVRSQEPFQASYLATLLQVEFPACRVDAGQGPADAADLVLVQGGAEVDVAGDARPAEAPLIVVARGPLTLAAVDRLVSGGADDVLDLAQLTAARLAAAVLKALRRHSRLAARAARPAAA